MAVPSARNSGLESTWKSVPAHDACASAVGEGRPQRRGSGGREHTGGRAKRWLSRRVPRRAPYIARLGVAREGERTEHKHRARLPASGALNPGRAAVRTCMTRAIASAVFTGTVDFSTMILGDLSSLWVQTAAILRAASSCTATGGERRVRARRGAAQRPAASRALAVRGQRASRARMSGAPSR